MAKARSIVGFMLFLWALRPRRARALSAEERRLVEHYRALSQEDRVAMRYLLSAMGSVSRF